MICGFWICCVFGCWYEVGTCDDAIPDTGCDGTPEMFTSDQVVMVFAALVLVAYLMPP